MEFSHCLPFIAESATKNRKTGTAWFLVFYLNNAFTTL